jgi:DNA-binding transcriptional ArsR family regulator
MSTLPDPRAYKSPPQQPEPKVKKFETEWFVAEGEEEEALPEPEFEGVETEVQPTAPQIHIPAIPTSPPAVVPQAISAPAPAPVPVQIPVSLGPTWEPDEPFNPIVLQTLTEAERMIVEASSMREVSPSDDELQARLEVGRSRLSQIYNGMRRKGLLSVRKQGRTRYFKLSEAADQHLRGAPQGVV